MADYTSNFRLKLPEASEYFNIDDFNSNFKKIDSALKSLSSYVESASFGLFPEYNHAVFEAHVSDYFNLLKSQPYFDISKEYFDCKKDGLLIWRGSTILIEPAYYHFVEQDDSVRVQFSNTISFDSTDTLYFVVYIKPNQSGGLGVLSTSAVGVNMATSSFVLGTAEIPWET